MGLLDSLKAAVTPLPPAMTGEEFDVDDDPFYDVEDDDVEGEDGDDSVAADPAEGPVE